MTAIVHVCIPNSLHDHFDYAAGDVALEQGMRVRVPFRNTTRLGVVVGLASTTQVPAARLKTLIDVLDASPLLPQSLLTLCRWVSRYYQSPLSEVIALALPKAYRLGKPVIMPQTTAWKVVMPYEQALQSLSTRALKQRMLLALFHQVSTPLSIDALKEKSLYTPGLLRDLCDSGILEKITLELAAPRVTTPPESPLCLHAQQQEALNHYLAHEDHYYALLLQGVTGSGKTEVYLHCIAKALARGRQVLVLVPEIGLTPQLLARFKARFNQPIGVIHSHLNERERQHAWHLASTGYARIVIGTRAAVFTPMPDLGFIILDEEHDTSLKQMEGVRYSARDTALMRACQANIPIMLGSATPSLESLHNAREKKYALQPLSHKALNSQALHMQIMDLRNTPLQHGLAPATLLAIERHLACGNQVLVFINRRGFSPVLLCHQCAWIANCTACSSHLTLHQDSNRLICHHCSREQQKPARCPSCHSPELVAVGAGTQRIHTFLTQQFPGVATLRIDRDAISHKGQLDTHLQSISKGEVSLIIGTQMLAKGHHFPHLTLVVMADADNGLYNPDFRALERLGQLVTQVAGRAGRAEKAGEFILQTHFPHHPLLTVLLAEGYEAFANALLAQRKEASLPPYTHLALLRAQSPDIARVLQFLNTVKHRLTPHALHILGPAPAPLALKSHQHRMQLLLKCQSRPYLQSLLTHLRNALTTEPHAKGIRWNIDVDPVDLS